MNPVPPYMSPAEIAKACSMDTREARGMIARAGILESDGPHRYKVDTTRLRERLPAMYERVFSAIALRLNETT